MVKRGKIDPNYTLAIALAVPRMRFLGVNLFGCWQETEESLCPLQGRWFVFPNTEAVPTTGCRVNLTLSCGFVCQLGTIFVRHISHTTFVLLSL